MKYRKILAVILAIGLVCMTVACGTSGSDSDNSEQKKTESVQEGTKKTESETSGEKKEEMQADEEAADKMQSGWLSRFDERVEFVRGGSPVWLPDVTYADAYENFYGNPRWRAFDSTDNKSIVEFSGECTYNDEPAEVYIQFELGDDDSFTFAYCSLAQNGKKVERDASWVTQLLYNPFESYSQEVLGKEIDPSVQSMMEEVYVELMAEYDAEYGSSTNGYEEAGTSESGNRNSDSDLNGENEKIAEAYKTILKSKNADHYITYDIDNDGVKELFLHGYMTPDQISAEDMIAAYSWDGGSAYKINWEEPDGGNWGHVIGKDEYLYVSCHIPGESSVSYSRLYAVEGGVDVSWDREISESEIALYSYSSDDESGLRDLTEKAGAGANSILLMAGRNSSDNYSSQSNLMCISPIAADSGLISSEIINAFNSEVTVYMDTAGAPEYEYDSYNGIMKIPGWYLDGDFPTWTALIAEWAYQKTYLGWPNDLQNAVNGIYNYYGPYQMIASYGDGDTERDQFMSLYVTYYSMKDIGAGSLSGAQHEMYMEIQPVITQIHDLIRKLNGVSKAD